MSECDLGADFRDWLRCGSYSAHRAGSSSHEDERCSLTKLRVLNVNIGVKFGDHGRYGLLSVLFFLVRCFQLAQQHPRENDAQGDTYENAKDDENRDHERLKRIPPIPSNRTTAPIITATNPTYFCSKSRLNDEFVQTHLVVVPSAGHLQHRSHHPLGVLHG